MIPNQPGAPARSFLVAAVAFASLSTFIDARAQEPSPDRSHEVIRPVAQPGLAAAAVAPRINSISHSFTGSVQEQILLEITFSQNVTGFTLEDIQIAGGVTPVPPLNGSGNEYSVAMTTSANYQGIVQITIASNVAHNVANEGNIGRGYLFEVDNKDPEIQRAVVDRDELTMTYSEDLDEDFIPSVDDFSVSYIRDGRFGVAKVSKVEVDEKEMLLTLEERIQFGDQRVEMFYDDRGATALRDLAGNLAPGLLQQSIANITSELVGEAPGPPLNLTADAFGANAVDLEWDAPSDTGSAAVTGYRIEVSSDEDGPWDLVDADTESAETTYRHTGLGPSTTYYYQVFAINAGGESEPSDVASATTESLRPNAPRRLTAKARGASIIELDWSAPFASAGGAITGYRIEVSPTGTGRWTVLESDTNSRDTDYTHTGLNPGTTRHYRVYAINSAGRSAPSNVAHATTRANAPGAPTGLRAVPSGLGGTNQILLSWTRPASNGGSTITGYRIEMSAGGITGWTQVAASTGSAATTYLHGGLAPGTRRYYRVAAINAVGRGSYSNVALGATNAGRPGQPRGLRVRADGPRSITITWGAPVNDNGARITGYRIRARSPNDNSWITIRSNTGSTETTFTHTNLRPVTVYRYQVAAINSVGAGDWSLEASTGTHPDVPSAPSGLTARAIGTSRIDLSWQAPRNTGGAPVIGYRVEASNDGRNWRIIRSNTGSPSRNFSHRNLQPASTWFYRVSAINAAGVGTASNVARATTAATIPGAPRDLTAEADGTSRIDLAWDEPAADGGAEITGYRIEVSEDRGANWQNLVANTRNARTTYSHTGLAPATTRHYRVSAINRIGTGRASGVASATTDATVPDAPTGLVANATSPTRIDLAWVAPAYDGGAAISGYRIEVSQTGTGWTDLVSNTGNTATSYSHTELLPGSRRFYRISAINRAGTGEPSEVASAATDDPVQRAGRLNTRVLPHVAAAMTSSTVSAIADRIDAVASGMGMERRMEMGGLSSMTATFASTGARGAGLGRYDRSGAALLLGGSSFQMPLGATDSPQQAPSGSRMATWGAGEFNRMGEPGATALDWSGNMINAHVGADMRVASDILAGVAASYSSGTFDFTDKTGAAPVEGTYATAMTSVNPYVAWFQGERGNAAWGTYGIGWGDIEIEDEREDLRTSPARMMTGAAGGSYQLLESGIGGVRIKAEGWAGRVMVDGGERIDSITLDMQRAKLALEWMQGYRATGGNEVAIVLEGGMRYDNGGGINGASAEVGGGLRYSNARLGLTAEGRGRLLISARDSYEEWGFGGMIQLDPGARGEGLQVRVAPSYGDAASGVNQLWERGVSGAVRDRDWGAGASLDAEAAYGLPGFRGAPYTGFYLSESGVRAFSSGLRYDLGPGLGLRIEGTRREAVLGGAGHSVGIRGRLRFR